MLLALIVMVIWGFNFAVAKFGLREFSPMFLMCLRFVGVAVVLLPSGTTTTTTDPLRGVDVARVPARLAEPMTDFDARRSSDAFYARASVLPDEPEPDAQACAARLRELAGQGPALELAVGHGRIAIPLAATGIEVDGIDISAKAIELLRAHPKGGAVNATVADMSDFTLDREYSLVYLVFNGIMNLTTQDAQVRCFEHAARHLRAGGRFVIECVVPALRRLPPGNPVVPFAATEDYIGLEDFVDRTHLQIARSRHFVRRRDGTFRELTAPFRYVWPAELDLMARIAGMTLEDRWAGWDRSAFTGESESHVSVWQRA
jgi:SAM-dependent methyltransferase